MSYSRVLPRDLFNEAKLLKCLGRLALIIHDGTDGHISVPNTFKVISAGDPFEIEQKDSDGGLFCRTVLFMVGTVSLHLYSSYNSIGNYPLICETSNEVLNVFEDDGCLTSEFIELINREG